MSLNPQPYSVLSGANRLGLGSTHYTVGPRGSTISNYEIASELAGRGYVIAAIHHAPPPTPPALPTLNRSVAINIAIDVSIFEFNKQLVIQNRQQIPRTSGHFYRCPGGRCNVDQDVWQGLTAWAAMLAQGYMDNKYEIPSWGFAFLHSSHVSGLSGLGNLGGFAEWAKDNAWVFTALAALFASYGAYLTTKQVEDAIKDNVPDDYLNKGDIAAIIAALTAAGGVPAGKEGTVAAGVTAAATPSWMIPVMVGGAALVVVLLLMRK